MYWDTIKDKLFDEAIDELEKQENEKAGEQKCE